MKYGGLLKKKLYIYGMGKIIIERKETYDKSAYLGMLYATDKDGNFTTMVTLENKEYAIPKGNYPCYYNFSPKFDDYRLKVAGVKGRTNILFHQGNTIKDTRGCILVGIYYLRIKKEHFIGKSNDALKTFHTIVTKNENFTLTIK
jgi:hypothetical protein